MQNGDINSKKLFALCDANNFFVSCERVFAPQLKNKPTVVLSNNDGCVVARSNEVKKMGVPMGAPFFKYEDLFRQNNVSIFSSNFSLYSDMSYRLMSILSMFTDKIEVYSVDEAFLDLSFLLNRTSLDREKYCEYIVSYVEKNIGLPISIGIAETKTLAKLGAEKAKSINSFSSVFDFSSLDYNERYRIFKEFAVDEIWGVGRGFSKKLKNHKVGTVAEFVDLNNNWVRKNFNVTLATTQLELLGESCTSIIDKVEQNKSISVSRTFGKSTADIKELSGYLSSFSFKAFQSLQRQTLMVKVITVYLRAGKKNTGYKYYEKSVTLDRDIDDLFTLTNIVLEIGHSLYKSKIIYKKAGIILHNLKLKNLRQINIEDDLDRIKKLESLNQSIFELSNKFGYKAGRVGMEFYLQKNSPKRELISRQCTTNINDLHPVY